MGAAVMLLQEVRNWPGGQGVLLGYVLLPYRGILHVTSVKESYQKDAESYQKDALLSFCLALSGVRFIFFVMGMFLKMTCGRC